MTTVWTQRRRATLGLLILMVGGWAWAWKTAHSPVAGLETVGAGPSPRADSVGPGLCPWRHPQADLQAFFPGADRYDTQTLFLSGLRQPILQRLGPGQTLDSNVLYVYPIWQGRARRGEVLVDRAAGEYGAIEVVVGVDTALRVAAVRLQRLREPPEIADVLRSPRWLGAFTGKTAASDWRVGGGLPSVPPAAAASAGAVARTVRALLIKADVAERNIRPAYARLHP